VIWTDPLAQASGSNEAASAIANDGNERGGVIARPGAAAQ
jgi:hypothetical protein